MMKKVLSVVLALAMMLGLCGTAFAAVSQADIVGVWNMDMNAILNMMGEDEETIEAMKPFLSMMKCTMEFTAEGTYAMKMSFLGEEENMEGNYELADGKISMDGGDFAEATIENDVLTIMENDTALTFTRAGAESESAEMSEDEQMAAFLALIGGMEGLDDEGNEGGEEVAAGAGKLEVVSENGMFVKGYSNYYYVFAKVQNTGDAALRIDECKLTVLDEAGAEIASRDYGDTFARFLKPGESTFVKIYADVGEATPAAYQLTVTQNDNVYSEDVRYPADAEMLLNVDEGWTVGNYMVALVSNDTDEVLYDVEVAMALLDDDGRIVYIDDKSCFDVGIPGGSDIYVSREIPEEFIEYYNTNGVKLQSVEAFAYKEVDLDW